MAPTDGKHEKVTGWESLVCYWSASSRKLRNLNQIKISVLGREMMGLIHTIKAVGPIKKVIFILFLALAVSITTSCAGQQPIPVEAYGDESATLFENLPTPLKSAELDVLYATDRAPDSYQ